MIGPLLFRVLRTYAPYITLPFAAVIGVIGYNFENLMSDKYTPYNGSVKESRNERLLNEPDHDPTKIDKHGYTKVLEVNVSPSLQQGGSCR